jgi:hypothetical protein
MPSSIPTTKTPVVRLDPGALPAEVLRRRQQLAQVLDPRLRLGRSLLLEVTRVAGPVEHPGQSLGGGPPPDILPEPGDQVQEAAHLGCRARGGAIGDTPETLEQGDLALEGEGIGALEGGLADSSRRPVDDASQRDPVGGVHDQSQVGEGILHLGPVVEAHAPHHHVGHVVLEELLLEQPGLRVGAVEDREIAEGAAVSPGGREDLPHDVLGLAAIVERLVHRDRLASSPLGEEVLALAVDVVRDHGAGPGEDGLRRAVVALEHDHFRVGIVALEIENVANVGAAPRVDRLVGVAHHAQVAVLAGDLLDELVLGAVRVLVLVDQDVLPAALR